MYLSRAARWGSMVAGPVAFARGGTFRLACADCALATVAITNAHAAISDRNGQKFVRKGRPHPSAWFRVVAITSELVPIPVSRRLATTNAF